MGLEDRMSQQAASRHEVITSAVAERMTAYAAAGKGAEVCISLVHFPDGVVVPIRMGDAATIDAFCSSDEDSTEPSRKREPAPPAADSPDVVMMEFAKQMATIVAQCSAYNAAQTSEVEVRDTVNMMRRRRLAHARDYDISRRAMDGSVPAVVSMPYELWRRVAEFLPAPELMELPAVVRPVFRNRDDIVWGTLFERNFPLPARPKLVRSWRALFIRHARVVDSEATDLELAHYLRDVCPTGSVKLGRERFQIVDFYPSVRAIQQRLRGGALRIEAASVNTAAGPVTLIALLRALGNPRQALPFVTSAVLHSIKAAARRMPPAAPPAVVKQPVETYYDAPSHSETFS
jgi:hypothetical protein